VVALLIVLVKMLDLSRVRGLHGVPVADLIEHRLTKGNEEALALAEKKPFPANRVLSVALKYADHQSDVIEEVIIGEIRNVKTRLERLLPFLAIIAATSPLMGLLGTVVGMIKTFSLITVFGSGNAQSFSAGISEALVTTEFGLIVAIPALILHGVLLRSAREKLGSLEDLASEFVISLQESRKESA
jgi:biopolymer transport protein ExbB